MSSEKQVDGDNETVASSTEKTDEPDESKSKATDDDDDDDTSSNASSEYEVERILAKRKRRRGQGLEYYIKWVGYDDSANEWIPASSLNCPDRLKEFNREEEQKRKLAQQERSTTQKRRSRNSKTKRQKRRRVKVIEDDDENEEEEDDEEENIADEPAKSVDSPTNSEETSKVNSVTYGVEKGYKVQAILGINRAKGEQLHYLVHYQSPTSFDDNMELIPAETAKKYCEDEIIQFYETRIAWNDRPSD